MCAVCDYADYARVAERLGKKNIGLKDGKIYESAYKFCSYRIPPEYEIFKAKDKGRTRSKKSKSSMKSSRLSFRGRNLFNSKKASVDKAIEEMNALT